MEEVVGLRCDPVELRERMLNLMHGGNECIIESEQPTEKETILLGEERKEILQLFLPVEEKLPGFVEVREETTHQASLAPEMARERTSPAPVFINIP
jgi:hypothetical protein